MINPQVLISGLLLFLSAAVYCFPEVHGVVGHPVKLPCTYPVSNGISSMCWDQGECGDTCVQTLIWADGHKIYYQTNNRYQLEGQLLEGDVSLTIENTTESDSGLYCCRVEMKDPNGVQRLTVSLRVQPGVPTRSSRRLTITSLPRPTSMSSKTTLTKPKITTRRPSPTIKSMTTSRRPPSTTKPATSSRRPTIMAKPTTTPQRPATTIKPPPTPRKRETTTKLITASMRSTTTTKHTITPTRPADAQTSTRISASTRPPSVKTQTPKPVYIITVTSSHRTKVVPTSHPLISTMGLYIGIPVSVVLLLLTSILLAIKCSHRRKKKKESNSLCSPVVFHDYSNEAFEITVEPKDTVYTIEDNFYPRINSQLPSKMTSFQDCR